MGHSHGHGHSHGAASAPGTRRIWPMAVAVGLIGGFFVVELITGILVNSLALIADAGHMLTDVVALVMGLAALLLARHGRTTDARSFGWYRAEVFTAVANAVLLIGVEARAHIELAQGLLDRRIQRQPLLFNQLQGSAGGEQF